jgi:rare lipoprotein A (peptidoglycan hydrolase)
MNAVERSFVAHVGAIVFAILLVALSVAGSDRARSVTVSAAFSSHEGAPHAGAVLDPGPDGLREPLMALELPEARVPLSRSLAQAASVADAPAVALPAPAAVALAGVVAAPVATQPPPEPLVLDGIVIASWYGPGFYGNLTACGQTYTPEILGVAHRTLPCGTRIRLLSPAGETITVPVIDRGPFIAGRSLDLSNATRIALRCSDLCHVRMTVLD